MSFETRSREQRTMPVCRERPPWLPVTFGSCGGGPHFEGSAPCCVAPSRSPLPVEFRIPAATAPEHPVVPLGDAALVGLARSGNADAFEELVRRHQVGVFRIAIRMLGDPADAEDAAQEAFLQAWRGLPQFRLQSTFSTWIYRIITNRCLNLRRARRPSQPLRWDRESPEPSPDQSAHAREQLAALSRAILELTSEQRAAFVLRHLEGCTYEAIAEILGISRAAVKSRLHRARLELVAALSDWE